MRPTRFIVLTGILAGFGLMLAAAPGRPQSAPAAPVAVVARMVPAAPAAIQAMAPVAPLHVLAAPVAPVAPISPARFQVTRPNPPARRNIVVAPEAPAPPTVA